MLSGRSLQALSKYIERGLTLGVHLNLKDSVISGIAFDSLSKRSALNEVTYRVLLQWKRTAAQPLSHASFTSASMSRHLFSLNFRSIFENFAYCRILYYIDLNFDFISQRWRSFESGTYDTERRTRLPADGCAARDGAARAGDCRLLRVRERSRAQRSERVRVLAPPKSLAPPGTAATAATGRSGSERARVRTGARTRWVGSCRQRNDCPSRNQACFFRAACRIQLIKKLFAPKSSNPFHTLRVSYFCRTTSGLFV